MIFVFSNLQKTNLFFDRILPVKWVIICLIWSILEDRAEIYQKRLEDTKISFWDCTFWEKWHSEKLILKILSCLDILCLNRYLRLACFLLSSASQSGLLAGSPEPSELSIVSAPILPPPGGVVAVGTGSGSDGLLPPAELPEVFSEAAEDLVFESSEARRVPFLSPLEDERLPRASCKRNNRYVKSLISTCLV